MKKYIIKAANITIANITIAIKATNITIALNGILAATFLICATIT